jgi:hypothetical protein
MNGFALKPNACTVDGAVVDPAGEDRWPAVRASLRSLSPPSSPPSSPVDPAPTSASAHAIASVGEAVTAPSSRRARP